MCTKLPYASSVWHPCPMETTGASLPIEWGNAAFEHFHVAISPNGLLFVLD